MAVKWPFGAGGECGDFYLLMLLFLSFGKAFTSCYTVYLMLLLLLYQTSCGGHPSMLDVPKAINS